MLLTSGFRDKSDKNADRPKKVKGAESTSGISKAEIFLETETSWVAAEGKKEIVLYVCLARRVAEKNCNS